MLLESAQKRSLAAMSGTWQSAEKLPTSVGTEWYHWRVVRAPPSSCPHPTSWSELSTIQIFDIAEIQHFIQDGDPELAAAIDGIAPVRELHETFLNLEPLSGEETLIVHAYHSSFVSGQPMQAHKRIQISVPVLRSDRFDILKNVAEVTLDSFIITTWTDTSRSRRGIKRFKTSECVPPCLGGRGSWHWLWPWPGEGGQGLPCHTLCGCGRCHGGIGYI